MSQIRYWVFYAGLLYGEYTDLRYLHGFPDGAYIYRPHDPDKKYWYMSDLTPVLDIDVPKELKMLCLVLNININ